MKTSKGEEAMRITKNTREINKGIEETRKEEEIDRSDE